MNKLPLHPKTASQVESYLKSPTQFVIVLGPAGSGQEQIAQLLAAKHLNIDSSKVSQNSSVILITRPKDKKEIPIELVRGLIARLKVKASDKWLVLIELADQLSSEAQNALLKTLEQTPANTFFILSANKAMLPTVMSRAQLITVKPITLEHALEHFGNDKSKIVVAWNMSEGAAGLLGDILSDSDKSGGSLVGQAKTFITSNRYQRALMADKIAKDRAQCLDFLDALGKVVKALHHAQIKKGASGKSKSFIESRKTIEQVTRVISANGSVKLAMLNLVVNLKV